MTADQLIPILRQRRLIPEFVAEEMYALRSAGELSPDPLALLARLVSKGLLTSEQSAEVQANVLDAETPEEELVKLVPVDDVDLGPLPRAGAAGKWPAADATPPTSTPRRKRRVNDDDDIVDLPLATDAPIDEPSRALSGSALDDIASSPVTVGLKNLGSGRGRRTFEKSRRSHAWDSPLVLYGGASLLLLAGVGGLLYYLLFRESAEAALKRADALFQTGAYAQAEQQYEDFIERFSGHSDYSVAKVRRQMTRLWQAVEGSHDYSGALKVAQAVIPQIEEEPAFISGGGEGELSQAKQELSTLLTRIATGLAEQAEEETDGAVVQQRVEELETVLALTSNTKYVPERYRLTSELDNVEATLERVGQTRERDVQVAAALAAMDDAIAAGEPGKAFAIRREILREYPVLTGDERLDAKLREAGQAEQKLVRLVEQKANAETTPIASPIVAELTLAERSGPGTSGAAGDGPPVIVNVDGALYALRPGNGALAWRRRIGSSATALVLSDGDVVAADGDTRELVRLARDSGRLVWRLPLDDELVTPVAAGRQLLVAARSGKLYVVDAASGDSVGYVAFSQPLTTPPCLNERGDRIYVVGERSNVYTLSAEDFSCLAVFSLGHAPGGVVAPPAYAVNKVLVAENVGIGTSQVHALSLDERAAVAKSETVVRLVGLATTPLAVAGRRLGVVTSLGEAVVFEVGAGEGSGALSVVARRDAQDKEHLARFALLDRGNLWIGGDSLAKFEIQPTENKLATRPLERDFHGEAFDAPLQLVGDSQIVGVRRPNGGGGASVFAVDAVEDRVHWETAVAAPAAGPPAADRGAMRLAVASTSGAAHVLDRAALARRVSDEAMRTLSLPRGLPPFTSAADLGAGRLAIGGAGSATALLLRPDELREPLSVVPLAAPLASDLVPWRDGFVAPTRAGQVFWFDASSGAERAAPFQPPLIPGRDYDWLRPAVVGDGADAQLAISDGADKVYLVGVEESPTPHLEATASVDVGAAKLVTQLAATSKNVFAGTDAGELISYAMPELERQAPIPLGGKVTWGPFAVGDGALVATDEGELLLVGDAGEIRWRQPLAHGALTGSPLVASDGGNALVLARAGGVATIPLADGAQSAYVDLDQPVVDGPVEFGNRLVVVTPDGSLLVVNRP